MNTNVNMLVDGCMYHKKEISSFTPNSTKSGKVSNVDGIEKERIVVVTLSGSFLDVFMISFNYENLDYAGKDLFSLECSFTISNGVQSDVASDSTFFGSPKVLVDKVGQEDKTVRVDMGERSGDGHGETALEVSSAMSTFLLFVNVSLGR